MGYKINNTDDTKDDFGILDITTSKTKDIPLTVNFTPCDTNSAETYTATLTQSSKNGGKVTFDKSTLDVTSGTASTTITGTKEGKVTIAVIVTDSAGKVMDNNTIDFNVVGVVVEEFIESGELAGCTGYDDGQASGGVPALMVPLESGNKIKVILKGASKNILPSFKFTSKNNKVTVSPATPTSEETVLTISGQIDTGRHVDEIHLQIDGETTPIKLFEVDVLKRVDKTVAVHVIYEDFDDNQLIPEGTTGLAADAKCIDAGANNVIDIVPAVDDQSTIINGSFYIVAGANGRCDTDITNINIKTPTGLPSKSQVEEYLNKKTWGTQANVHFTVTMDTTPKLVNWEFYSGSSNVNIDQAISFSHDNEHVRVNNKVREPSVDYNIYFVSDIFDDNGVQVALGFALTDYAIIEEKKPNHVNIPNTVAHEVGHLLKQDYTSPTPDHNNIQDALMYGGSSIGCSIKREDWNTANP